MTDAGHYAFLGHASVRRHRSRGRDVTFHVWSGTVPARSMFRIDRNLLVSGPELTLLELCGSSAKLDSLLDSFVEDLHAEEDVLWSIGVEGQLVIDEPKAWEHRRRLVTAATLACEFSGTYRLSAAGADVGAGATHDSDARPRYGAGPLMTLDSLRQMAELDEMRYVRSRALKVVSLAFEGSASPMETALALLLTMPLDFGGFGLPKPVLNKVLDLRSWRSSLSGRDEITPDMLWEKERVCLEYDSSEFHRRCGAARLSADAARQNVLGALGYTTFRATPETIGTLADLELLARQIAAALGVTLSKPNDIQALRRRRIYAELMPRRMEQ